MCKQDVACKNLRSHNFHKSGAPDQCRPWAKWGPSVCRQCCAGDRKVCDFYNFSSQITKNFMKSKNDQLKSSTCRDKFWRFDTIGWRKNYLWFLWIYPGSVYIRTHDTLYINEQRLSCILCFAQRELVFLTLRRPLRQSWRIGVFFGSHGSALS